MTRKMQMMLARARVKELDRRLIELRRMRSEALPHAIAGLGFLVLGIYAALASFPS